MFSFDKNSSQNKQIKLIYQYKWNGEFDRTYDNGRWKITLIRWQLCAKYLHIFAMVLKKHSIKLIIYR